MDDAPHTHPLDADTIACRDHCPACRRPWRSCACGDSGDTLDREHDESTAARTRVAQGWAEGRRAKEAA